MAQTLFTRQQKQYRATKKLFHFLKHSYPKCVKDENCGLLLPIVIRAGGSNSNNDAIHKML